MSEVEIKRAAMRAVMREVGVAGLVLFLRDRLPGSGDYVVDREKWLPEFDTDEEFLEALAREGQPEPGSKATVI